MVATSCLLGLISIMSSMRRTSVTSGGQERCQAEHHALMMSVREGLQLHGGRAKIIPGLATGSRNPNTAHCLLELELPRRTTQSSTGWNSTLLTKTRDRAISANHGCWSPMAHGSFLEADWQLAYTHPLWCQVEGPPPPSPIESEIAGGMPEYC